MSRLTMQNSQGFTIDKVGWHTQIKGNPETPEHIKRRFAIVVNFLQQNELTTRTLLHDDEEVTDEFAIHSSDLTGRGFELMKLAYDKWLRRVVDRRKDINDLAIFEEALAKLK